MVQAAQAQQAATQLYLRMHVQANALPNPEGLAAALQPYLDGASNSSYLGCMKSGAVETSGNSPWFEPASWKFGGVAARGGGETLRNYPIHAGATGYALSRAVAIYVALNADMLAVRALFMCLLSFWCRGMCCCAEVLAQYSGALYAGMLRCC